VTRELEEVGAIDIAQTERVRKARDNGLGRIDRPALLETRVPRDAHGGALCNVLATKTGRTPAAPGGQAELFRIETGATLPQELRELGEPNFVVRRRTIPTSHSPRITAL
jgi:hypothetical protein